MQNSSAINVTLSEAYKAFRIYKSKQSRDKRKKLKSAHLLTAKHLLFLTIQVWNNSDLKQKKKGVFLKTNKVALAKECNCTTRTIGNHLDRLIELGIILQRETLFNGRGRWAGIRVLINPECFINEKVLGRKKIPHLVLEALETKKYKRAKRSHPEAISKNMEEQVSVEVQRVPSEGRTSTYRSNLTLQFWTYAKAKLFWDRSVKKPKEQHILNLISKQLNEEFWAQKPQHRSPDLILKRNMKRIDRAASWFDNRNVAYTPDPLYYFTKSKNGLRFNRLLDWEKKKSTTTSTLEGFEEKGIPIPEQSLIQIISNKSNSTHIDKPKFNPVRVNLNSSKCLRRK